MSRSRSVRAILIGSVACGAIMVSAQAKPWNARLLDANGQIIIRNSEDTHITHAGIPDLCASPDVTSIGSGDWDSPAVWSSGAVPGIGAKVLVNTGHTVTYNVSSANPMECVGVRGILTFSPAATTKLTVEDLFVYFGGELRVGTEASPITGTAEVVFDCYGTCLDSGTVANPGIDPEQFGVGLIALGKVRIHGATKTPYVRLGAEVSASATTLTLGSTPTGWAIGDELVLPDSKARGQVSGDRSWDSSGVGYVQMNESRTISAISGTSVTVGSAWTYVHPAAKDVNGTVVFYPHVGNLSRNVTMRSIGEERAHTMFHARADVDVRYAAFKDLGRTTNFDLHCTLRTTATATDDADCVMGTGAITQIGTNQKGRYPVHFHQMEGPTSSACTVSSADYQGCFIGNVVTDGLKWPITIHDSSYLLVKDNITYNGWGASIMFEEGNEHYNVLDGNFMVGNKGDTYDDTTGAMRSGCATNCADPREHGGREGSGIWARGFHNYFRNNISAGHYNDHQQIVSSVGYKLENGHTFANSGQAPNSTGSDITIRVPNFPGARLTVSGEYTPAVMSNLPILEFRDNEAYGALETGMTVWYHQHHQGGVPEGSERTTIDGLNVWHVFDEGFFGYPLGRYDFIDLTVIGPYNDTGRRDVKGFVHGDYHTYDLTFTNPNMQNLGACFGTNWAWSGRVNVTGGTYRCDVGFEIQPFSSPNNDQTRYNGEAILTLTDIDWAGVSGTPFYTNFYATSCGWSTDDRFILMWFRTPASAIGETPDSCYANEVGSNASYEQVVKVNNFNGDRKTFEVYYLEQETHEVNGGLTPCTNTASYSSIRGFTCNIR